MITHTIGPFELAWTLIAVVGFGIMLALFHRTMGDYVIAEHYNGSRQLRIYAAKTSVIIFTGGLVQQAAYIIVGIVAMTQPSLHQKLTAANYITGTTFITSSLLSVGFAAVIYYRRVKIIEMLERQGEKHG